MEHFEEMEMKLWEYIDGLSIPSEKSAIEKLIAENTEWRNKYQELTEAHQLMQSTELEEPSLRFTKNVMEEIAKFHVAPAAKKYLNNKVIWGIGIFFIVTILGFVIYGVAQVNWHEASNSKSTLGIDMDKLDFGRMFNNTFVNIFVMLNIVLALMFLDRYLSNKRKEYMNNL
jgi:preprotein translocase subunit Sss1